MNIVALGKTACDLADKFKKYSSYKIYQIDDNPKKRSRFFLKVPSCDFPQEYEQNAPIEKIEKLFKSIKEGDILFVTCGSDFISSLSLVILEQLNKHSRVSVVYLRRDPMFLSARKKDFENVVYMCLQNYTMMDFLEQMYVVSYDYLEKFLENIDMENYQDQLNEIISWGIHSINFYDRKKPIIDNYSVKENYGIKTVGISKFGEGDEEKLFFLLDNVKEKRYYYIVDKILFGKAKEDIRNKIENEKCKVFYGLYSSDLKENIVITIYQTMKVQK